MMPIDNKVLTGKVNIHTYSKKSDIGPVSLHTSRYSKK